MQKFFSNNNSFYGLVTTIVDILILNVLWIICSIPIVTIGASTTAVYYVCLKMVKDKETYIIKSFLKSFRDNLKQGTILWLLFIGVSTILGAVYYYVFKISDADDMITKGLIILITIIYVFSFLYVYPLLARFDNPFHKTIINSFMISIRYLKSTIIIILLIAVFVVIGIYSYVTIILVLLLGMSALCYVITSFVVSKIFVDLERLRVDWEEYNTNNKEEIEEDNKPI